MNRSALIRLVSWSMVLLVLVGILVMGLLGFLDSPGRFPFHYGNHFGGYSYQYSNRYTPGGGSVDANAVGAIAIDWISGDIEVIAYEGDTVTFSETAKQTLSEKDQLQYYLDNGTLRIRFCSPRRSFGTEPGKNLSILVPQGMLLSALDVDALSSSVHISGLDADQVGIENFSGNTTLSSVRGSTLDFETMSGNLQTERSEFARLDAESVSGRLRIEGLFRSVSLSTVSGGIQVAPGGFIERIDAESVSGSITVTLPQDIPGFTADMESVSGHLSCDFAGKTSRNGVIYGDGFAVMDFESVSGSVIIRSTQEVQGD